MAIKVEAFGTRQKKTCFGCGSMISFENDDIEETDGNTFIICPVCGKRIKAYKIDRAEGTPKRVSEFGKKAKEAFESNDWDEESKGIFE